MTKPTIIAELGINHQGDLDKARLMVEKAKEAGADIAKFQWYDPETLLGKESPYLEEARSCQFTLDEHLDLKKICDKIGIEWCVSAFHDWQIPILAEAGMKRFKVASRAALDDAVLREIAKTTRPVILSTGLCTDTRLHTINNLLGSCERTFLYCVCRYPTRVEEIDLRQMERLASHAHYVGLSSHCPDIWPAIEAIRLGATVIEQHITLDKKQIGCDISSSITFDQLELLCDPLCLVPVETADQVEWLRVQRSRPELYRYFRQDRPLTPKMQKDWWTKLDRNKVRLFLVDRKNEHIGYVGFNPFSQLDRTAEFGIFIVPEHTNKGYGSIALKLLLRLGFEEYGLSTIYSDVLNYPGENRFNFYEKLGFRRYPQNLQIFYYQKGEESISSTGFFMTKEIWGDINGKNHNDRLEFVQPGAVA